MNPSPWPDELLKSSFNETSDVKVALDGHVLIAVIDPQGKIIQVNDRFCAISKYSRAELTQAHDSGSTGLPPHAFASDIWGTLAPDRLWKGELKHAAKDGSFYWADTTMVPFLNEAGRLRHYIAIQIDITERKRSEADVSLAELKRANAVTAAANLELAFQVREKGKRADELAVINEERLVANQELAFQVEEKRKRAEELALINTKLTRSNEALERSNGELAQFAYVASHDLQTPLRNISGFVQLLKENYADKLDEQGEDWIRRIIQSSEQMHTLIRDVLQYSRVDSRARPFEAVSLDEVFADAVGLLETSIRDAGGKVTGDELPAVTGDRSQLVQLLQNLIGNGLKYHGTEPPHVHVSARRNGGEWIIATRDNGIGIAAKHYERIFEIFKRLHNQQEYPGTGIGLAVCRRVVHRHGGRIWVESEAGHGSTFKFTIPEKMVEKL